MVATTAKWAWTLENDHGEFVASNNTPARHWIED
jgi:hypothetical protein